MLSRADLFAIADALAPRLVLPPFPLTAEQSSALEVALRAIDDIRREDEDLDCDQDGGPSLTTQLDALKARQSALAPAVDAPMAAQEALAEVGLEFSVRIADGQRCLVVSQCRPTAPRVNFEREA